MLALFEKGLKAPEPLPSFPSLFMEHTQVPLALIPMTEDENVSVPNSKFLYPTKNLLQKNNYMYRGYGKVVQHRLLQLVVEVDH